MAEHYRRLIGESHALEKGLVEPSIAVTGRFEQLEPSHVVPQGSEAEQILEEHHPVPSALPIVGEKASREHDAKGGHRGYRASARPAVSPGIAVRPIRR